MPTLPLQFLLLTIAGWMTRDHQKVTEYLLTENAVLREQLRGRRIVYSDSQRRRLATAAKELGRKEVVGITDQPHEAFMKQMARNLTDAGILLKHRYIIMDRAPLFCHSFRDMEQKRYADAEPMFREALASYANTLAPDYLNVAVARFKLGRC